MDPKAPSWESFAVGLVLSILLGLMIGGISLLTGCATESTIRRKALEDVDVLIQATSDCPTTCAAIRAYLKSQLGAQ